MYLPGWPVRSICSNGIRHRLRQAGGRRGSARPRRCPPCAAAPARARGRAAPAEGRGGRPPGGRGRPLPDGRSGRLLSGRSGPRPPRARPSAGAPGRRSPASRDRMRDAGGAGASPTSTRGEAGPAGRHRAAGSPAGRGQAWPRPPPPGIIEGFSDVDRTRSRAPFTVAQAVLALEAAVSGADRLRDGRDLGRDGRRLLLADLGLVRARGADGAAVRDPARRCARAPAGAALARPRRASASRSPGSDLHLAVTGFGLLALLAAVRHVAALGLHALSTGCGGLLHPARERELTERVDVLTRTRRGALDVQAAELRRIERDLHDGAQARLVALSMQLGRAEERLEDHPEAAELVRKARVEAGSAINELRDLARGIAPPVLADRGLPAAVEALGERRALPGHGRARELDRRPVAGASSPPPTSSSPSR